MAANTRFYMKNLKKRKKGFTLIELLTVIAIIGILAGILIPVVGSARKSANKAKSKTQLNGYANAIIQYKSEYGYWPPIIVGTGTGASNFNIQGNEDDFMFALSGRSKNGTIPSDKRQNRKAIPFYSFSDQEFYDSNGDGTIDSATDNLGDPFDNPNIYVAVDKDGNGIINASDSSAKGTPSGVRAQVVLWTLEDDENAASGEQFEDVTTWD